MYQICIKINRTLDPIFIVDNGYTCIYVLKFDVILIVKPNIGPSNNVFNYIVLCHVVVLPGFTEYTRHNSAVANDVRNS